MAITAKVWVLINKTLGRPTLSDFKCIEEELSTCNDGDIIIEAEVFSVDPYMRFRLVQCDLNTAITGSQVAKVIESKNEAYPVGTYLVGRPGWRTHTHLKKEDLDSSEDPYKKISSFPNIPKSTALGVLGMPGNTAYFGFLEICQPKPGETVLVNAAAGAVGHLVCQIAKIKGCKVIAFAGSDAKVAWLEELGVDHVYNYKVVNVSDALKESAPAGINCYFDNVGGQFTASVMPHMAEYGRISVCGSISVYNEPGKLSGTGSLTSPFDEPIVIFKQLKIQGFIVTRRWADRWEEGIAQLKEWIDQGKLKYRETTSKGFEKMPSAFLGLFDGENIGKAVVLK